MAFERTDSGHRPALTFSKVNRRKSTYSSIGKHCMTSTATRFASALARGSAITARAPAYVRELLLSIEASSVGGDAMHAKIESIFDGHTAEYLKHLRETGAA